MEIVLTTKEQAAYQIGQLDIRIGLLTKELKELQTQRDSIIKILLPEQTEGTQDDTKATG